MDLPLTGFEDREHHRTLLASVLAAEVETLKSNIPHALSPLSVVFRLVPSLRPSDFKQRGTLAFELVLLRENIQVQARPI